MSAVTIREAVLSDIGGIALVHVESWKTTYAGLLPDAVIAERNIERRTQQWTRQFANESPTWRIFVAEESGRIVAYAMFGVNRWQEYPFTHELLAIYCLAGVQGRGIGKNLVRAGVEWLLESGAQSMLLWVITGNRLGRGFYDRLGGSIVGERTEAVGVARVEEVAYGWPDLRKLQDLLGE